MKYNTPDNKLIYESIFDRRGHSNVKKSSNKRSSPKYRSVLVYIEGGGFTIMEIEQIELHATSSSEDLSRKAVVGSIINDLLEDPDAGDWDVDYMRSHCMFSGDFKQFSIHEEYDYYVLAPHDFGYNEIVGMEGEGHDNEFIKKFMEAHDASRWSVKPTTYHGERAKAIFDEFLNTK